MKNFRIVKSNISFNNSLTIGLIISLFNWPFFKAAAKRNGRKVYNGKILRVDSFDNESILVSDDYYSRVVSRGYTCFQDYRNYEKLLRVLTRLSSKIFNRSFRALSAFLVPITSDNYLVTIERNTGDIPRLKYDFPGGFITEKYITDQYLTSSFFEDKLNEINIVLKQVSQINYIDYLIVPGHYEHILLFIVNVKKLSRDLKQKQNISLINIDSIQKEKISDTLMDSKQKVFRSALSKLESHLVRSRT